MTEPGPELIQNAIPKLVVRPGRGCHDGAVSITRLALIERPRTDVRPAGSSELVWTAGDQVDFYDRPELVTPAVEAADRHFRKTLPA